MSEERPQSPPWRWPGEWLRDQSFWRDIATRTAAGVIVVFVVWAVGIATGLISQPGAIAAFANVAQCLAGLSMLTVGLSMVFFSRRAVSGQLAIQARGNDRSKDLKLTATFFRGLGIFSILLGALLLADIILLLVTGENLLY